MEKIAVIEDDPGIRTVIRLALKGARFGTVCEAGRGDDGLAFRKRWVRNALLAAVFGVLAIMAMAAAWEIIEWIVAVWDGGADGLAFLGSQGDVWDAQKDMLCDTLGAISAAILFVTCQRMTVGED